MKKLIITLVLTLMAGCTGYKVVYTCDDTRCFYQAVLPWQESPAELFGNDDTTEISDEECLAILNLIAKHYDRPKVEPPVNCNKQP